MEFDFSSIVIPLWTILVFYGIFLLGFFLYSAFNLYHLVRFGTAGVGLYAVTALFLLGSAAILIASFVFLAGYDWSSTLPLSGLTGSSASKDIFNF